MTDFDLADLPPHILSEVTQRGIAEGMLPRPDGYDANGRPTWLMTAAICFVQDALAEAHDEDFDVTIIQDKLRRGLLELYEGLEPEDRQSLFNRYQSLFDAVLARNANTDRFMPPSEVMLFKRLCIDDDSLPCGGFLYAETWSGRR